MADLDSILNGTASIDTQETPEAPAPNPEPQPETIGQPRDEGGRFAPKEPTGEPQPQDTPAPAPEAPPASDPEHVPFAALKDERAKRQAAEDRIAKLEAQFASMQPAPQPQTQTTPAPAELEPIDLFDDPDRFIETRFDTFGERLMAKWEQRQATQRVNASEHAARAKYPDFEEKVGAFQQAVQLNPALAREMVAAADPAEFAYSRGKAALQVQQFGSIEGLIAAERAKWEQEAMSSLQPAPDPGPTAPMTTAADRSASQRGGPAWSGPTPLDQIIG